MLGAAAFVVALVEIELLHNLHVFPPPKYPDSLLEIIVPVVVPVIVPVVFSVVAPAIVIIDASSAKAVISPLALRNKFLRPIINVLSVLRLSAMFYYLYEHRNPSA